MIGLVWSAKNVLLIGLVAVRQENQESARAEPVDRSGPVDQLEREGLGEETTRFETDEEENERRREWGENGAHRKR
jgi:hypothetical protein